MKIASKPPVNPLPKPAAQSGRMPWESGSWATPPMHSPHLRTANLTGNRVPLAFQTLEKQLYEMARQSPLVRPADEGMPDILRFLTGIFEAPRLESLVDSCAAYLGVDWNRVSSGSLLASLYRNLLHEDDVEGYVVTTGFFARLIDPAIAGLEARDFVLETVQRYLHSVAYLHPLLFNFSFVTLEMARSLGATALYLFLRDALVFWPSLHGLRDRMSGTELNFLIYTRSLSEEDSPPLLYREAAGGTFQFAEGSQIRGMLVDAGLYGTLVQKLDRKGYIETDTSVYFLGSRNPHIPGFLNQVLQTRPEGVRTADFWDIVKAIDTIECLLKPVMINSLRINRQFAVLLELSDFISFVCAAAFFRESYVYAQSRDADAAHVMAHLDLAQPSAESWYLAEPIPTWSGAAAFLRKWSTGNLLPASRIDELFRKLQPAARP